MRLTPRRTRAEGGYSLIEMIAVTVLLASALIAVLPNLQQTNTRARANDAARQIQSALLDARMRSINEEQDFVIQFAGRGWNIYLDRDRNGTKGGGDAWVYAVPKQLPPGIYFQSPETNNTESIPNSTCGCARFRPNGTLRLSTGSTSQNVTLGFKQEFRKVTVSVAGATKLQRWNAGRRVWE